MFEKVTKKLARKMGQSVREATAPVRVEVTKTANNKVDLWSRVLRLGVLVILFVEGTKRVVKEPEKSESCPNQIVINNYVDTKPYRGQQRPYVNDQKKKGG